MNNSSPIVVTGGTGTVGHHVVDRLRDAERRVRVVSRHDRSGDTRTGLEWAVADLAATKASSVRWRAPTPWCTARPATPDVRMSAPLGTSSRCTSRRNRARRAHLDRRCGPDSLRVLHGQSGGRTTAGTIRARLQHPALDTVPRTGGRTVRSPEALPVLLTPDIRIQPIAAAEVADELARLAAAPPAGRVPEVGGPEIIDARDLARTYAASIGARKGIWPIRLPGRAFAAFRAGNNLTPERAVGVQTFSEYLA